jgi:hypothetical protein
MVPGLPSLLHLDVFAPGLSSFIGNFAVLFGFTKESLISWAGELGKDEVAGPLRDDEHRFWRSENEIFINDEANS